MNRSAPLRRSSPMPRGRPLEARAELKRGKPLRQVSEKRQQGAARVAPKRRDTIPPQVRCLVTARDPWCVRCGSPRGLHQHHRRLKGQGGDPRLHTDCCCNLVRLCSDCHLAVHTYGRRAAEAEGFILAAETALPGSASVAVRTADGGLALYPGCDGAWSTAAPEGTCAA